MEEFSVRGSQFSRGKVSVGKGCIRFKRLENLNVAVAIELVKNAAALVRKGK